MVGDYGYVEFRDRVLLGLGFGWNKGQSIVTSLFEFFSHRLEKFHSKLEKFHSKLEKFHSELEMFHSKLEKFHSTHLLWNDRSPLWL